MKDLHQLNTGARIDFKILHVTFNNLYNLAPYYMSLLLVKYQPVRSLHSSIGFFQQVPPVNTVSYAYPLSLVFILCTELRSVTVYIVLSNTLNLYLSNAWKLFYLDTIIVHSLFRFNQTFFFFFFFFLFFFIFFFFFFLLLLLLLLLWLIYLHFELLIEKLISANVLKHLRWYLC